MNNATLSDSSKNRCNTSSSTTGTTRKLTYKKDMTKKKTVKNHFGIDIVCCCSSCIHNVGALSDKTRSCNAGEGEVLPSSWCAQWSMKRKPSVGAKLGDTDLDMAGRGGGHVKKKTYLDFVRDAKTNSRSEYANYDGEALQKAYESKYASSIYINP